jgi:hypothetical protein
MTEDEIKQRDAKLKKEADEVKSIEEMGREHNLNIDTHFIDDAKKHMYMKMRDKLAERNNPDDTVVRCLDGSYIIVPRTAIVAKYVA